MGELLQCIVIILAASFAYGQVPAGNTSQEIQPTTHSDADGNTAKQNSISGGLRFTEISFVEGRGTRGIGVRFEWMAAPELRGPQIGYEIVCEADVVNHRIDEETETEMSLLLQEFRPDQQYVCTLTATDETADRELSMISITLTTPSIPPISPVAAIATLTVGVASFVIVGVVTGVVVYICKSRKGGASATDVTTDRNECYGIQRQATVASTTQDNYSTVQEPSYL